jgi:REP element-mobilizing transposase RayT
VALDAGYGSCILRNASIAAVCEEALIHGADKRYLLHAWIIMPNHVHELVTPFEEIPLPKIVQTRKSCTSKAMNRIRGVSGQVWQREYFDRYIRDIAHAEAALRYIEENPVKAGLAETPEEWRFGNAWHRSEGARLAHL